MNEGTKGSGMHIDLLAFILGEVRDQVFCL